MVVLSPWNFKQWDLEADSLPEWFSLLACQHLVAHMASPSESIIIFNAASKYEYKKLKGQWDT